MLQKSQVPKRSNTKIITILFSFGVVLMASLNLQSIAIFPFELACGKEERLRLEEEERLREEEETRLQKEGGLAGKITRTF